MAGAVRLLAAAAAVASAAAADHRKPGLRDWPVVGSEVRYLSGGDYNGEWTATSSSGLTIAASVPGDLLTDLQRAGQIGDPLYENNWLNSSIWDSNTWTYKTTFTAHMSDGDRLQLVFDGVKMGARVLINGAQLGTMDSQFLRRTFDLKSHQILLHDGPNVLEVVFDPAIDVKGRFMACTGGWDWAPYSNTKQGDARTFSKGIWKDVYLVRTPAGGAAITHVVPKIHYLGEYPTTPLEDGKHGGFRVDISVFLDAAAQTMGELAVQTTWGATASRQVGVGAGEAAYVITVPATADDVKLWWPAGMGAQPLYGLTVSFQPAGQPAVGAVTASRRVGFRYFALVTGNDTDPDYVTKAASQEGSSSHGMYFRINGAAMWSRGANMIPMEELEGRMLDSAHRVLVRSALDGGFNTLRVWGGGMFLPDVFYDECDELGLIVYHDMQYAQEGHSPAVTDTQDRELRHQVRRLSAHTSIVIWDGCNECQVVMGTDTGIYATFVMTTVAEEDNSRAVWPSCPALGWTTGVRRLDALPNGNALTTPKDGTQIEFHGDYQHGTGFPAVNGDPKLDLFDPMIPIQVSDEATGLQYANSFVSESGAAVMSSFESMSPTLAEEHWALHAGQPDDKCEGDFDKVCTGPNVMAQRNYPCDNFIQVYFGVPPAGYLNTTGEVPFKKQLYQCMLGQALLVKSWIEARRSQNHFGFLTWQFNEIWPTGGWGSVEYGTPVKGQVLGGRWKPLHYFYKRSIFRDVMATCGKGGKCFVKNDAPRAFEGACAVRVLDFASGALRDLKAVPFEGLAALPAGAGTKYPFTVDLTGVNATASMLVAECKDSDAVTVSLNEILLATPEHLTLPTATVTVEVASALNPDGSVDIALTADKTALYVTLTTLAHGRFSDNAFALAPGKKTIQFLPFGMDQADVSALRASLRVEHLQQHQFLRAPRVREEINTV